MKLSIATEIDSTGTEGINEFNAAKFSDNYRIEKTTTGQMVCCEHNETEAKAIAAYLRDYHGMEYLVVRNSADQVRAAKAIRGNNPVQLKNRLEILKQMGVA